LAQHPTSQVHHGKIGGAPPQFHPEGQGAVRVEPHRDRRLADAAPLWFSAQEQPIRLELSQDVGHGLGRQARELGDLGPRQGAVPLHE
jgi:hypothetical protein